MTGNLACLPNA